MWIFIKNFKPELAYKSLLKLYKSNPDLQEWW
jgi:hypothetical protein